LNFYLKILSKIEKCGRAVLPIRTEGKIYEQNLNRRLKKFDKVSINNLTYDASLEKEALQ
jgi:hypothetical protein